MTHHGGRLHRLAEGRSMPRVLVGKVRHGASEELRLQVFEEQGELQVSHGAG